MTDEELDRLCTRIANLVIEGIIKAQNRLDKQFFEEARRNGYELQVTDFEGPQDLESQEEILLGEIARLMTMLEVHVQNEQYEKAAIVKNKIRHLENRLKNE